MSAESLITFVSFLQSLLWNSIYTSFFFLINHWVIYEGKDLITLSFIFSFGYGVSMLSSILGYIIINKYGFIVLNLLSLLFSVIGLIGLSIPSIDYHWYFIFITIILSIGLSFLNISYQTLLPSLYLSSKDFERNTIIREYAVNISTIITPFIVSWLLQYGVMYVGIFLITMFILIFIITTSVLSLNNIPTCKTVNEFVSHKSGLDELKVLFLNRYFCTSIVLLICNAVVYNCTNEFIMIYLNKLSNDISDIFINSLFIIISIIGLCSQSSYYFIRFYITNSKLLIINSLGIVISIGTIFIITKDYLYLVMICLSLFIVCSEQINLILLCDMPMFIKDYSFAFSITRFIRIPFDISLVPLLSYMIEITPLSYLWLYISSIGIISLIMSIYMFIIKDSFILIDKGSIKVDNTVKTI